MNEKALEALEQDSIFASLSRSQQQYLLETGANLRLSRQYLRQLTEAAADLEMWDEGNLKELLDPLMNHPKVLKMQGTQRNAYLIGMLREELDRMRSGEIEYQGFHPRRPAAGRHLFVDQSDRPMQLLGACPVAGEKTRCCNLLTLDAVRQCGFACSYCSIQSFYDRQRIYFFSDLPRRLQEISSTLDQDQLYHIGTGQSSDSLMFGNRHGVLDALTDFARDNPRVILELKTKSGNIAYLLENRDRIPENLICTWSLNPQLIIEKEEHRTASLSQRLDAARRTAEAGILTGFHIHPMIRYTGWQKDYRELFLQLQEEFSPQHTVMISFGTLTFIKPVLQQLRSMGIKSRVLQIPLSDASGKYSYPREMKEELFSFAYQCFSSEWKQQVFFYLCMEPASLWNPVFGFSYRDNEAFEQAMKSAYFEKIQSLRERSRNGL